MFSPSQWFHFALDFFFTHEPIHPPEGGYLDRWILLKLWGGRGVYLHRFCDSDWTRYPHDHPKDFISVGLKGSYKEEEFELLLQSDDFGESHAILSKITIWKAPWFRRFPAEHIHRIQIKDGPVWTLCFVGKHKQPWQFFTPHF